MCSALPICDALHSTFVGTRAARCRTSPPTAGYFHITRAYLVADGDEVGGGEGAVEGEGVEGGNGVMGSGGAAAGGDHKGDGAQDVPLLGAVHTVTLAPLASWAMKGCVCRTACPG